MTEQRDERGRFRKGMSGNPGGRPRSALGFREACRELAPKALKVLEEIMGDTSKTGQSARVLAARIVIEHGFGKALQQIADVTDKIEDHDVRAVVAEVFGLPSDRKQTGTAPVPSETASGERQDEGNGNGGPLH